MKVEATKPRGRQRFGWQKQAISGNDRDVGLQVNKLLLGLRIPQRLGGLDRQPQLLGRKMNGSLDDFQPAPPPLARRFGVNRHDLRTEA